MTEEKRKRKPLSLKTDAVSTRPSEGHIRQSLSHGRSKTVTVEVKKKRHKEASQAVAQEASSKLTDQEQSLRWRAVHEAKLVQSQQKKLQQEQHASESLFQVDVTEEVMHPEIREEQVTSLPTVGKKPSEQFIQPEAAAKPFSRPSHDGSSFAGHRKKSEKSSQEETRKAPKSYKKKQLKLTNYPDQDQDIEKSFVGLKKLKKKLNYSVTKNTVEKKRSVEIKENLTVLNLATLLSKKVKELIFMLVRLGIKATPHSNLDPDTAQIIAEELGFFVKRSYEKDLEAEIWNQAPVLLKKRPPIVTVMGHVNHGKTSLLDALKKTDVAHKEAGGITQHIGSYQVHLDKDKIITFIDTPGHEAFAKMRIRGAQITDLVILVVAADEGVNAQTIEAITHAKSANVPIIVAINKIDKANARPDHVRQELLMHGIVVEKLGGDVQDVEISALRGTQLDSLEEAILLQAEVLELNADDHMRAKGVLLETSLKKGHGIMTTLLIQEGCLSTGDVFVAGHTWGRVRLIVNDKGQIVKKAGPSQPVQIVGFTSAPQAGDRFVVVPDEACAKNIVQWKQKQLIKDESSPELMSLALHLKNQGIQELHLVMKADTQGSLEALLHEFSKIQHDEVAIHVVYKGVGAINESDALLAQTTGALLLAFHVDVAPEARKIIEQRALRVISHRVIYHIVEEVQKALSGLLIPIYQEEELGYAQVIQIFPVKKMLPVAGCIVKEGFLRRGELVRVTRHGNICHEGLIKSIRHVKDDVKEINTGYECGVIVEGYRDVLLGDILRCFAKKEIQRSIG